MISKNRRMPTSKQKQLGQMMAEYMVVAITIGIALYFVTVGWNSGDRNGLTGADLPDLSGNVPGMVDAYRAQQDNFIQEIGKP